MDSSILRLFELLPQLMSILQIVIYVILAWFFGAIAMKGLKKHLSFPFRIVLTFCVGFVCLVFGTVLSGYMVFLQGSVLKLFQLDLTIGGFIASVIIAVSLYLISKKVERTDPKNLIKKLKKRVGLLEGLLVEHEVHPISERLVRRRAEKLLPEYSVMDAKLNKTDWEIYLHKGKRKAKVVMGAYDGELKIIEHDMSKIESIISDPFRIVGIGVIIFILAFSLISFKGFPSMTESLPSLFGMSSDELTGILGGGEENLPEGCVSAGKLALKYSPQLPLMEDESVEMIIEGGAGIDIQWMYRVDYEGTDYILAIDANFENICSATYEKFCQCIKIPSF